MGGGVKEEKGMKRERERERTRGCSPGVVSWRAAAGAPRRALTAVHPEHHPQAFPPLTESLAPPRLLLLSYNHPPKKARDESLASTRYDARFARDGSGYIKKDTSLFSKCEEKNSTF